ncbi:MAG: polyprenyl synthetase family protein [bacterium]
MDIQAYLTEKKAVVEDWLKKAIPPEDFLPATIHKAMHYSLMARSKRIRPVLTLAATEAAGGKIEAALPFACALELIHTYSLIHDDLPAMDNDDFRRGQPTNHKVFGEAMAILAGDALLTQAFILMSAPAPDPSSGVSPHTAVRIIQEIARAAGTEGMIGGQVMDVELEGQAATLAQVEDMHHHKTGAMLLASVRVGGLVAEASPEMMESFTCYGRHIGLAFQIVDDILNVEGQPEILGKSVGSDRSAQKATFPAVSGLEESKILARQHYTLAVRALEKLDSRADALRALAEFVVGRRF